MGRVKTKTLCRIDLHSVRSKKALMYTCTQNTNVSCGAAKWPLCRWCQHLLRPMGAGNACGLPHFCFSASIIAGNPGQRKSENLPDFFQKKTLTFQLACAILVSVSRSKLLLNLLLLQCFEPRESPRLGAGFPFFVERREKNLDNWAQCRYNIIRSAETDD